MAGRLRTEREGAIGWIVLDNPERLNAISGDMWREFPRAMAQLDADPEVRVVILRGEGEKAFAVGMDISEFEKSRTTPDQVAAFDRLIDEALHALQGSPKPVISMIRGFCMGGGVEISLACDLRYCSADAQLAIPAARLGLGYGADGTKRLIETVGHANAREIFFTGRRYSAAEALSIGLVHQVLPVAELEAFVRKTAAGIAENAPLTIAASKILIEEFVRPDGEPDLARGLAAIERCALSEDYQEGRRAFMEKRKPQFRGR
ncbi:MAG: enoyl-CoA hydratase/isomerase family protein [Proteobacteria bacterium]|nr:enoyl-CoA hydratase/isomerase family protein [Pseudomonadota bacterium]